MSELLSVVCPVFNEAEALGAFFDRLVPVLDSLELDYEIVCVDDGSRDATLECLLDHQRSLSALRVIELSRNFGKEAALTAGIDAARGTAVVPIDVDLQDPPEVIAELVARWRDGFDVVLARRSDRKTDTFLKRMTATLFYRLHNRLAEVPIPENVGDFRLLSRPVVQALQHLPERRRFMKGLFAWVGFRTTVVDYVRAPRSHGASKFNGWRLWNFALEGIAAFSSVPLRIWTYFGAVVAGLAFAYGSFIILRTLVQGIDLPGYASLVTIVLFLGGVQLIGLGVLGEYLERVHTEVRQRPIYLIRKKHELTGN